MLLSFIFIVMIPCSYSISTIGDGTIRSIAPGGYYTLALLDNGTVWTWGFNYFNTLGVDFKILNHSLTPCQIQLPVNVKDISAGEEFALALMDDGTVWAWGSNADGELGIGSRDIEHHPVPVQVQGLYNVKAVSSGSRYALALKGDGTVWMWGNNEFGQRGDGHQVQSVNDITNPVIATAVQVPGLDNVMAISAGTGNPAVVRSDGTVWSWGYNASVSSTNIIFPPTMIEGFSNAIDVRAESGYIIALRDDGTVWSWGDNYYGCLGNDSAGSTSYKVLQVKGLNNVIAIDTGINNCIALKDDGTVYTWGENANGQAGDSSTKKRNTPYLTSLRNITSIYAGNVQTAFAIGSDGTVWAWGGDEYGQLGDSSSGKNLKRTSPITILINDDESTISPTAIPATVTIMPGLGASPTVPIQPGGSSTTPAPSGWQANWVLVPLAILISITLNRYIKKK